MKPFYHNTVFFEATTDELCSLRAAVANMTDVWSDQREDGTYYFPDEHEKWEKLYKDLTKILEQLPF